MTVSTVSMGLISGLFNYAVSIGVDSSELMERSGISELQFDRPDSRLPFQEFVNLMHAAQHAADDPALALHFGEAVGMSQISIVGLIMEASQTMGEAFAQLQRYGRLAAEIKGADEEPRFSLVPQGSKLFMVERREEFNAFKELTEESFVHLVCGPRRFLKQPHVLSVHFTFAAPAYRAEYDRIFKCPVYFEADWNALELHPDVASWPVAQNPRYVFSVLTSHADSLLDILQATKTVRGETEGKLLTVLHHGEVRADTIAASMGFSRQTLFRRLKKEGTTFAVVHDELRERIAKEYLKGGKTSVAEVAYLVGFSDPASFSHAFKKWVGQAPSEYARLYSETASF